MIFIVLRHDKPGAERLRNDLKAKHREFLASLGNRLLLAGAIFDDAGNVTGGSITFQASNAEAAHKIAEQDPYACHTEIALSTKVIPFRARWKDGLFYDGDGYVPLARVSNDSRNAINRETQTSSIRDAEEVDAPILARAEQLIAEQPGFLVSRSDELKEVFFAQKIKALKEHPRGKYIVATVNSSIVGHALLDPVDLKALRHIVRLTIVVHQEFQGRGIGKAMLRHLIGWAREASGVEKIELLVREKNERAIALYRSLGFQEEGRFNRRIKLEDGSYLADIAMALWVGRPTTDRDTKFVFRRLTNDDLVLLHEWLNRPHIAEQWDGKSNLRDVQSRYQTHINSEIVFGYLALLNGSPLGFVQAYDAVSVGDGWWSDAKPGTWGIDLFLANESDLGKGLGTTLLQEFSEYVFGAHRASQIIIDPSPENPRAIRCYEKAGFKKVGVVDTPDGNALLMVKGKSG